MYSTKTATVNSTEFTSSYMPVGINENVTLKEVNVNKTQNGRDFLEIIFENAQGQTATMTEWKNEKNMWIKTDEDLQRRDDAQFGRILQVIYCYYPEEQVNFEGSSFVEMINWVKQTFDAVTEKKAYPLRLKVVYDKNGYTKVSNLGVFVESMSITESQIKLWKNDLLERPVQPDKEDDPLGTTTTPVTADSTTGGMVHTTSTGADDLPF